VIQMADVGGCLMLTQKCNLSLLSAIKMFCCLGA
jgi:hypothetical protein